MALGSLSKPTPKAPNPWPLWARDIRPGQGNLATELRNPKLPIHSGMFRSRGALGVEEF